MKRFSKILACILTVCILCGVIVTAVFANTEPAYVHPTLTNASATHVISHNFEADNVGAYVAEAHNRISTSRIVSSALKIKEQTVNGVSNKLFTFTLPNEERASAYFLEGTYGANQRSCYIQFRPVASYTAPEWYQGVYDADLTDSITPVTNNFDYMTIDFDLSAQGARVDYADGTFGRAVEVTENADGSYVITLEDGSVVNTNADKTETTIEAADGTVTVWTTTEDSVTMVATAADGSKVETETTFVGDEAYKNVWIIDAEGNVTEEYGITRTEGENGAYTLVYDSSKIIDYAYTKVIDDATKNNYTETETYTIIDEDSSVTMYEFINKYEKKTSTTQYDHISTYRKTVGGEVEAENVSTFLYKNGGGSHTNKAYIPTFNSEFKALGEIFSKADLVGKHVADTRAAYAPISMYNTWRWYDATNTYKTATNNFYSIAYLNGSWGIFAEGTNKEEFRLVTLPDEIGVWNHISLVIEANNEKYTDSLVHFVYNGELLDTYKLSEKSVSAYAWVSIEDWRMTVNDILPKGDENFFSLGFDNLSINTYKPTVTYGEDGNVTERVPYSSGEAVGIDDFCKGGISLANCADTVYNANYMIPNENYYAIIGGVKYTIPSLAAAAIKDNVKNGDTIETGMDLYNIDVPEGIRYFNIKCGEGVICTLSDANSKIEKTEDGYTVTREYVYTEDYRYSSGNDKSYGESGTGSAGTYSTLKSVTYNGNAYTQYAYMKTPTSARHRYDLMLGAYVASDLTKGYHLSNYDYVTVDFDFFADKYVYTDANGEQVLTDTIPEGVTDYKLAYANGMNLALDLRDITNATSTSYGGGVFLHTIKLEYIDGEWHILVGGTDTGYVLSDKLYEVNHFTYAIDVNCVETDGVRNYASSATRLYYNGELIASGTINRKTHDATIRAIDWYFTNDNSAERLGQKFSACVDNFVGNYYAKGYNSGEMAGIDDLFADGKTAYTFDYDGLVYHAEYPLDPSVNGYVQINGGEKIVNSVLARKAIEEAPAGAVITSTRSFTEIVPSAPFTFVSPNGSELTIAEAALESFIAIKEVRDGVTTYTVREPAENDAITLEWYDAAGNLLATDTLLPSIDPDASNKNATVVDLANATAKIVAGWYWDLDGEGTAYSEAPIAPFGAKDIPVIGGTTVKVYPKMQDVAITSDLVYVAYYNDNGIIRLSDINASHFYDVSKIGDTVNVAPDGTVLMFMLDDDNIVLPKDTFYQFEGKSITFDLNGKTISRYHNEAYGAALIRVGEGGTAIVTSSVPGARVFLASKRNSTVEGNGNNRIFGADGIVQVIAKVDSAHVEISNLEFNGGTMVKFDGLLKSDTAPAWENDVSITCKIDNVTGYAPNRSSYAVIATLCPDVEVEVTNSKFYVPDGTYSFIHDYANDAKNGNYYRSETDLTIKNSEILCYTEGETPKLGKFWYTMGIESSLYVENSKIIANLNGVGADKAHWGAGVEIATDKTGYFKAENVLEGVNYVLNNGKGTAEMSLSFTRADFTTAWSYVDATNGKYIDSVYVNTVDISRSAPITFATFTDETIPEYVCYVDWYKADGEQSEESTFAIVGDIPKAPISFADAGYVSESTSWYKSEFTWVNMVDETENLPSGFSVVGYKAVEKKTADLTGLKANMSLSVGLVFNLYIPKADTVADIACDDALSITEVTVGGVEMICISFTNDINSFEELPVTITYSVDGEAMQDGVTVDALAYLTAVAKGFACGSEEAQLAYEIVAYKFAVVVYLAGEMGEEVSEDVIALVDTFNAIYTAHGEDCGCMAGLYNDDVAANAPDTDFDAFEAAEISSIAYILNSTSTGLFIDASNVTKVTYKNLLGEVVEHTEENGGLVYDDENVAYRVVGITAADVVAEMTIYVDDEVSVTYSLAQYIKDNEGVDVTKALYSYAMAARAYKAITASEKAAESK